MNPLNIMRLYLHAPLFYGKDESLAPFEYTSLSEEILFCFEIAPTQYRCIEPDETGYLGPLVFRGRSASQSSPQSLSEQIELPAGTYLFAQVREIIGREDFIWMAAEVQKEGLWERLALENRLYLRYLFEDGKSVTQVFRPYASEE